ncbi:hypothetical protein Tco_1296409, partial [Tanacetum coccineum]
GVESRGSDVESRGSDDESRGLDDEGHSVESNGLGLGEEEEAVLEGQQQAVSVLGTAMSAPLGLGFGALRRRELALEEDHIPPSPEWSSGSLPISPSPSIVPSHISSPMIPLAGGLIHDHAVRLEDLSPALFEMYNRDIRELFTRSGMVKDEIFSQSQTDAQRATMWHSISDTQRENRGLRLQLTEERRVRIELAEIVDSMRRGQNPEEMCRIYEVLGGILTSLSEVRFKALIEWD